MPARILIGTASWSDPGFVADWYPRGLPAQERLPYYAEHFNFVELNSSFYAVPERRIVQRWCEQTPAGFVFDVKLHRLLSRHATKVETLPPSLRKLARSEETKVRPTPALEKALVQEILRAVEPLIESRRIGAFLLQLSPAFSPREHRLAELEPLLQHLSAHAVAVELRNRHWAADAQWPETLAFFEQHQVALVSVDAPAEAHFTIMPSWDAVTHPSLAYLRLHGRDPHGYVHGRTVAERFNYSYSDAELTEIADRAEQLQKEASDLHIVFNNNAHDYAPRNAARFRELFSKRYPRAAPLLGQGTALRATAQRPNQSKFSFGPS